MKSVHQTPTAVGRKPFSEGWQSLAALFVGCAVIGLLVPLLSIQSGLQALVVVGGLCCLLAFGFLVVSALCGKTWAIMGFLALSVFVIDASFRQRESGAQGLDAQTLLKIGIWCIGILIALVTTRGLAGKLFRGDVKWLTLFSVFALCTVVYSLTPSYTFGAGVAAVAYCALAVCAVERLTQRQILLSVLAGLSLMLLLSLGLYAGLGFGMAQLENGNVLRLAGLAGSPNSLGRAASLAVLVVMVLIFGFRERVTTWYCWMPMGLAIACLVLSESRTSMLAVAVAFGVYLLRKRPVLGFLAICVTSVIVLVLVNIQLPWYQMAASLSRTGKGE